MHRCTCHPRASTVSDLVRVRRKLTLARTLLTAGRPLDARTVLNSLNRETEHLSVTHVDADLYLGRYFGPMLDLLQEVRETEARQNEECASAAQ